jgi:hypothetical protein
VQDGHDVGAGQDGRQLEGQLSRVGPVGQLAGLAGLPGGLLQQVAPLPLVGGDQVVDAPAGSPVA